MSTADVTLAHPKEGKIEDADEALDTLVQKASTPSLASLFQAGKDAGLIQASVEYGGGPTTAAP